MLLIDPCDPAVQIDIRALTAFSTTAGVALAAAGLAAFFNLALFRLNLTAETWPGVTLMLLGMRSRSYLGFRAARPFSAFAAQLTHNAA